MLSIFMDGTICELLIPHVDKCILHDIPPTPKEFLNFLKNVQNPNYKFVADCVTKIGMAIIHYRAAMRKNNAERMVAGRRLFAPVFFARNHPKYRLLEVADLADRMRYPSIVKEHVERSESFSVSGDCTKGESADFVLENQNKSIKQWVSAHPDVRQWSRSCNNQDNLRQVRLLLRKIQMQ